MAAAAGTDLKLEVTCSICTDIYTNPVTLICGHSFCQDCITKTFDNQEEKEYFCPECMKAFRIRPELNKNPRLSNIADYFRSVEPKTDKSENVCSFSSVGNAGKDVPVKDAQTLPLSADYDDLKREKEKFQKEESAQVKPHIHSHYPHNSSHIQRIAAERQISALEDLTEEYSPIPHWDELTGTEDLEHEQIGTEDLEQERIEEYSPIHPWDEHIDTEDLEQERISTEDLEHEQIEEYSPIPPWDEHIDTEDQEYERMEEYSPIPHWDEHIEEF